MLIALQTAPGRLACDGSHALGPGVGSSIAAVRRVAGLWGAAAVFVAGTQWPGLGAAQPIEVKVEKHGDTVIVDVEATVATEAKYAWAVLTDYDHMANYVSMLKSSKVVKREGNHLHVEQIGEAKRAFLKFTFHNLRAVELVPGKEVRSTLISGDFKSYAFNTQIRDKGNHTVVVHHGEYVPLMWVPPGIGPSLIKAETTKQFEEMIAEMLRRARAGVTTAPDVSASAPAR